MCQTAGDLANQYGHQMALHPGQVGEMPSFWSSCPLTHRRSQFTQVGSPKQNVVDASVRELHCRLCLGDGLCSAVSDTIFRPLFHLELYGYRKGRCHYNSRRCSYWATLQRR